MNSLEKLLKDLFDRGYIVVDDQHAVFKGDSISELMKFYARHETEVFDEMITQRTMDIIEGDYFVHLGKIVTEALIESVQGGSEWNDFMFYAENEGNAMLDAEIREEVNMWEVNNDI